MTKTAALVCDMKEFDSDKLKLYHRRSVRNATPCLH